MIKNKKENIEERVVKLENEIARIKGLHNKTISYQTSDPEVALFMARKAAEAICRNIFINKISTNTGTLTLDRLIEKLVARNCLPRSIVIPLRTIQAYGNFGSHDQPEEPEEIEITAEYVQPCLQSLSTVVEWYFDSYCNIGQDNTATVGQDNKAPVSQDNKAPVSQDNKAPVGQDNKAPVGQDNTRPVRRDWTHKFGIKLFLILSLFEIFFFTILLSSAFPAAPPEESMELGIHSTAAPPEELIKVVTYCFEGIFGSFITRALLFMGLGLLSIIITLKLRVFLRYIKSYTLYNFLMLVIFNAILIILSTSFITILITIDPYTSTW